MGASSHIISSAFLISSANYDPGLMLYVKSSFKFIGITYLECAVLPPLRSRDAIPFDATVNTIPPLERIADERVLQMKVFIVPP